MKQPRFLMPDTEPLPRELVALQRQIASLPVDHRCRLEPLYQQLAETVRRRRRVLAIAHEALSQLRLDVKYLLFDLDATRQEKQWLQAQLEGEED